MSIASEITRLQNAKSSIKTSIESKGVTVPSATKLDGYAALIDTIATGGGESSWTKLGEQDFSFSASSSTTQSLGTIQCGSGAFTKDKIIYIRVRDTNGKRSGHFIGSDAFYINVADANGSSSVQVNALKVSYSYSADNQYSLSISQGTLHGVYAHQISQDGGVSIRGRYSSSSYGAIDGTYHVEVYSLDYPDGVSPFDI